MTEEEVVEIVVQILEIVAHAHADAGRHEINRTDLLTAIQQARTLGLSAGKKDVRALM